ncbi:DNA translocase FtsK 4TM domain-containing protein [Algihabitans albus]|uniref:FtsK/SpoIIIE family DNA translocase n=1 Tax=Algihabitans albus TaxID=2164067 RepID=UPI0035CF1D27
MALQGTATGKRRSGGKASGGLRLLPAGAGDFLRKRGAEALGGVALVLGLAGLLALLTYHPGDPGPNVATDAAVHNLLGIPGAWIADLLLATLGLAASLIALVLLGWAWRLLRDKALPRWGLRLALLPAMLLLAAMALDGLPRPGGWAQAAGLGGFVGDLLLGHFNRALTLLGPIPQWVGALLAALPALAAFIYLVALEGGEYRAAARGLRRAVLTASHAVALAYRSLRGLTAGPQPEEAGQARAKARKRRLRAEPHFGGETTPEAEREAPAQAMEPKPAAATRVQPKSKPQPGKRGREAAQGRLALETGSYEPPPLALLAPTPRSREGAQSQDALEKNARLLEGVLEDFGVKGEIVKVRPGPVVTRYELEPAPGTKTSRVVNLADDIARSMSAISVRVAVVPGSSVIGIELPNAKRETVYLRELLAAEAFEKAGGNLPLVLGKDIGGHPQMVDLARMPHLLVAGTTGSGKSVSVNAMIVSLLYRHGPDRCRFIMVDPKMLELSVYDGIPHLLSPVVTDPKKAVVALKWAVREMEERYRAMSRLGVRNIDGYNTRIEQAQRSGEVLTRRVQTGFDPDTGQPIYEEQPFELETLPYIVVIVDEMADLMLVAGKEVEAAIQRLAQMARAAGIHLIMATQRPSVDVITGTIKANFPTRVSFQVTSKIDSRTILGESGAEHLLGMGDMLYMAHGGRISRVHGPFVSDQEVEDVVAYLKALGEPSYIEGVTDEEESVGELDLPGGGSGDELFDRAVGVVAQHRKASTSFIQRQLQIGYNRAARLVEEMEAQGIVGPANHVGKREILLPNHGSDGD